VIIGIKNEKSMEGATLITLFITFSAIIFGPGQA